MPLEIIIGGLIIFGFILILIEIFLVPGFNIFGIFGFVMVVMGIVVAYSKLDSRIANFLLIFSIILSVLLIRMVVKSKSWKRMVLDANQKKTEGFHASADNLVSLLGKQGITLSKLRPAGVALVEEEKVDVVTEGNFIEENKPIKIILVEGNRVVVREISENNLDID